MTEIDIYVNDCIKAFSNSLFHSLMTTTEAFFFQRVVSKKNVFFLFSLILLEKYKTIVSHAFSLKNNTMYKTKK